MSFPHISLGAMGLRAKVEKTVDSIVSLDGHP